MAYFNKVVIVNGALSSIGQATALLLAERSAKLVLIDKDGERLKVIAEKYKINNKIEVLDIVADVNNDNEVIKLLDVVFYEFRKIDVLINCADMHYGGDIFKDDLKGIYDKIFDDNMKSIISTTNAAMPYLMKTQGCVLNISSVNNDSTVDDKLIYNIFKAALNNFTKRVNLDFTSKGVKIKAVHAGLVNNSAAEVGNNVKERDFKVIIEPEDIAEFIVHIANDKSRRIEGANSILNLAP